MKCKCLIPKNRDKKGWKSRVFSVGEMSPEQLNEWAKMRINLDSYETCGGNLTAHVEVDNVPEMGGTYAELEVYFSCDKCKTTVHKYLPDKYSIEEFLTDLVEKM